MGKSSVSIRVIRLTFWHRSCQLQGGAASVIVGLIYPAFEVLVWNDNFGFQDFFANSFGAPFHDFAGSVVVHAVGGWLALAAMLRLGARTGRSGPTAGQHRPRRFRG